MTILTVTQPYIAHWITLLKPYVTLNNPKQISNMSVGHAKNVCRSQNSMKPFFLYLQLINNVFLLVSPAVLEIIDNPSISQDFLSFLNCV